MFPKTIFPIFFSHLYYSTQPNLPLSFSKFVFLTLQIRSSEKSSPFQGENNFHIGSCLYRSNENRKVPSIEIEALSLQAVGCLTISVGHSGLLL